MLIILEGPDGSGKTTLADRCERSSVQVIRMLGGRTEPHEVTRKRTYDAFYASIQYPNQTFVTERFHPISDLIYRELDQGKRMFSGPENLSLFHGLEKHGARVIYCRPMFLAPLTSKGDDDPQWLDRLKAKRDTTRRLYDMTMNSLAMLGVQVLLYDYQAPWSEDALRAMLPFALAEPDMRTRQPIDARSLDVRS